MQRKGVERQIGNDTSDPLGAADGSVNGKAQGIQHAILMEGGVARLAIGQEGADLILGEICVTALAVFG